MTVTVQQIALQEDVNPSTVKRWIKNGLPCVRRGRSGRGNGALLNPEVVKAYRREQGSAAPGLPVEEVVRRVADALKDALDIDHCDIRAGIAQADSAAVLIVVWDRLCKAFGVRFQFDAQPAAIRSLMERIVQ